VVLAVHRDAMSASLSPVIATLRDIETRHGTTLVHGLAPDLLIADPTGWTPATDLAFGGGLTHLLDTAKQRWRAQPHAAAALAWKCYTYWLALPAVIGYAGARRIPLPRARNVFVRYSDHQPFLTVALHQPSVAVLETDPLATSGDPRIVVCHDDRAMLAELRRALIDEHLDPMLERIHERVHLGRRTLWGSLASGAAHGLARAADSIWPAWGHLTAGPDQLEAPARPDRGPVLAAIGEVLTALDVANLVDVSADPDTGTLSIQRRTCCLAFTLPEPRICAGCCIK
jgi:hypothetical protein